MPHPNFHVLADNVRFFAENGVKGVFEQGCPAEGGGELTGLRAYVLSSAFGILILTRTLPRMNTYTAFIKARLHI